MDRVKRTLSDLALESVMIVFSVLLALAASSWAESHRERALVDQVRTSFIQEIRANRDRLAQALPYHRELTAAVLHVDSTGTVSSYAEWQRRVPIWSGFAPPDVVATAWQSALATGALARMPYGDVSALSNVYTLQGKLDAFSASYVPLFDFSDSAMAGTVRRMHAYMQTVMSYETVLMRSYDSALAQLGGKAPTR